MPPGKPTFSVIIVNYNGGEFLQMAIKSLAGQSFRDFELIVVDNNSEDGSMDSLDLSGLPHANTLLEKTNHGFAAGSNLGARVARGTWLAMLNPDAVAAPDWLERVHDAIARHPDCRVFACTQYDLDDPEQLDGSGDAYLLFGIPWRGSFQRPASELPAEGYCFSPCGASAIYNRDLFLAHDGFDERFFCYCEDVDLGMRLQLSGEDCIFLPDALIHHKGSGISGRYSYFTTFHGNRNRTWAYLKNMPLWLLVLTLPGHVALLSYIYVRNRSRMPNTGMADGIKAGFREGWKLRRDPAYHVPAGPKHSLRLLRSMAWNPWRMARRAAHVRPL
ncbi:MULTISPECIES: glycosyltransferase family 2 protein [Hyphomonas]|uniref:glycosyltransferase family 2 protein n=1 Tax=Hyphomonas TaxID=85 RepID=UPI003515AB15